MACITRLLFLNYLINDETKIAKSTNDTTDYRLRITDCYRTGASHASVMRLQLSERLWQKPGPCAISYPVQAMPPATLISNRQIANGTSLYYELHTPIQSENNHSPIVFLHGLGSSTQDWELQVAAFSHRYPLLCVDLRGHGLSDKPAGPYSIALLTQDLSELLNTVLARRAHIVGLSMGAQIGLQLALDFPDQTESLTVTNCPADMRPHKLTDHGRVWLRRLLTRVLGMEKLGRIIAERLLPGDAFLQRRILFAQRWAKNDPPAYRAAFNAIVNWQVTDRLHELTQPTLVVASTLDYTPMESKQIIIDKAPNATLAVIEDSRHAVPVERPEQFNKLLHSFIENVESAR